MEKKNIYDAIIIGGGASGLMCAITAKKHDRSKKIAIIEKNIIAIDSLLTIVTYFLLSVY